MVKIHDGEYIFNIWMNLVIITRLLTDGHSLLMVSNPKC